MQPAASSTNNAYPQLPNIPFAPVSYVPEVAKESGNASPSNLFYGHQVTIINDETIAQVKADLEKLNAYNKTSDRFFCFGPMVLIAGIISILVAPFIVSNIIFWGMIIAGVCGMFAGGGMIGAGHSRVQRTLEQTSHLKNLHNTISNVEERSKFEAFLTKHHVCQPLPAAKLLKLFPHYNSWKISEALNNSVAQNLKQREEYLNKVVADICVNS